MNRIPTLRELAAQGASPARARMAEIAQLALQAGDMARMDYDFLYDEVRHLLAIGYNVIERRRDTGYYDLLASEAASRYSSRSRKDSCRSRAGSRWGDCSSTRAAGRRCFPGAVRCSST
jgi:hypothetical protein